MWIILTNTCNLPVALMRAGIKSPKQTKQKQNELINSD